MNAVNYSLKFISKRITNLYNYGHNNEFCSWHRDVRETIQDDDDTNPMRPIQRQVRFSHGLWRACSGMEWLWEQNDCFFFLPIDV